jgi:ribosomal-protein-alanine N-acetyltransferase
VTFAHAEIQPLGKGDLPAAAKIHADCFPAPWAEETLADYLPPQGVALGVFTHAALRGFILLGPCTDQTDIVTLAVSPAARRQNLGRKLVEAAEEMARAKGAALIFLEVAEDNIAAAALYKGCGYAPIGRRKNYYRRAGGRVSAVTMRKDL